VSLETDAQEKALVLFHAEKHKKKIAEYKNILLKEFTAIPKENFAGSFRNFFEVIANSTSWGLKLADITQRNLKDKQIHDDDASFLSTAVFQVFFEGIYISYINAICLLLIGNGHDLYNGYSKKYCTNLAEIEEIDCYTKFEFIKIHGFGNVIRNEDRWLRNKIAHLKYNIIDRDNIKIENNKIDLRKRNFDLMTFVLALNMLTSEILSELRSQITP
jgi:hypothetical protein